MNCDTCFYFKKFRWTDEKGFCIVKKATSKTIVTKNNTCKYWDDYGKHSESPKVD